MPDSAMPIVEIKGVSKQFELQGERIEALRDAHLSLHKGEFVCLIGASGCGKSTLLRILAGFEQPTRGEALMWGMPVAGPAPARGMVFQDYGLFPWLNVRRTIGFVAGGVARTAGGGSQGNGRALHRAGGIAAICRGLSPSAFGRHEAAGRDRARARE